ncbi:MAG: HAD family hydrolase [Eubacteriales bacterium]|nr:HAD family hydrolase [Eubacteriales bacterium]
MTKLIVFDLDNTLCATGEGMTQENMALMRELEQNGARIAIASGKPTYYLCGFARQIGLKNPAFVGENGAAVHIGIELPPRIYEQTPYSDAARRSIALLREQITKALPDIWFQPNVTGLTPFPRSEAEFDVIQGVIDGLGGEIEDIIVYRHADSFDITPCGITKESGVGRLGALLDIGAADTIAVGDGVNDYPMFAYAGLALGVNVADETKVDRNFACVQDAMCFLLESIKA